MLSWERRAFAVEGLKLEKRADGGFVLQGHAAVFNKLSNQLGGFRERVAPGAFADTLKQDDVRALFNHDEDYVLGRVKNKTLRMQEDDAGLAFENDLPDTQVARDLVVSIERGDIDGMSFAFRLWPSGDGVGAERWDEDPTDGLIRTLLRVRLRDVSPVTFPAYPDTDVALRSMRDWRAKLDKSKTRQDPDSVAARRRRRLRLAELEALALKKA